MARFSGSDAVGAGFRIIGKHPFAVFIWGLVYLLLTFTPLAYGYWAAWPDLMAGLHAMASRTAGDDGSAAVGALAALRLRMLPYQMLQIPLTFLAIVLVYGAVYRAVLEPRNSGGAYLRLGAQELWLFLVSVVACILAAVVLIPVVLVAVYGGRAVSNMLAPSVQWLAVLAIVVATCALVLWLAARFSLAYPMSFAEGRFRLFQSWGMTRGHGWKIVGLILALVLILLLIEIVVGMVVFGVVLAGIGTNWQVMAQTATRTPEVLAGQLAPWLVGFILVYAVLIGAFHAIFVAPFADIYRQLTAKPVGPADFGG